jgi:hypothetical protein
MSTRHFTAGTIELIAAADFNKKLIMITAQEVRRRNAATTGHV